MFHVKHSKTKPPPDWNAGLTVVFRSVIYFVVLILGI